MSTSGSTRTIVLFEDHQARIDELKVAIKPLLRAKYRLEVFPLHVSPSTANGP